MSEPEFVFPDLDVKELVDLGDHDEMVQVSSPVCDFCFDLRVRWEYPCKEFVIDSLDWGSADEWVACDRCAYLIDEHLLPDLTARALRSMRTRGLHVDRHEIDNLGLIQQAFLDNRVGKKVAFG